MISLLNKNIEQTDNIAGYVNSADSLLLSNIIKASDESSLIILKNDTAVDRIKFELEAYIDKERIFPIHSFDEIPYDPMPSYGSFSAKKYFEINKIISSAIKNKVIITSVYNILKKLLDYKLFKKFSYELNVSDDIAVDSFKNFLVEIGYERTEQVSLSGQFSIRGSIIDIYPPGLIKPLRIDLYDDKIQSIKYFNITDQVSYQDFPEKLILCPTNEIIQNSETIKRFREKYRSIFEGNPLNNKIYTEFSERRNPQGINNYFPLLYKKTSSIFDYIGTNLNILSVDETDLLDEMYYEQYELVERRYDEFSKEQKVLNLNYLYNNIKEIRNIEFKKTINITSTKKNKNSLVINSNIIEDVSIKPLFDDPLKILKKHIERNNKVLIFSKSEDKYQKIKEVFATNNILFNEISNIEKLSDIKDKVLLMRNYLNKSFNLPDKLISFISEDDILKNKIKQNKSKSKKYVFADQLKNMVIGSAVVHDRYGIGRYHGLKKITTNNKINEYVCISYADNDKLYVPVSSLDCVNKYISVDQNIPLHKLGSNQWNAAKKKALKKVNDIAAEILELNAKRNSIKGNTYEVEKIILNKFADEFIYDETEDQVKAIDEVIDDLRSEKITDRLICGDVGFGKTEVAMRAAFIVVNNNKQAALVAPTTVLAEQHYNVFKNRYKNWPIRIESISRFKDKVKQKKIINDLKNGSIDILISTHRVFQKDIIFKNLGLLIIDEEQKFGVKHKEIIKQKNNNVEIISLTATPIPRTLSLSLGGLKDISIIATPPVDRAPIKTFNIEWDDQIIKDAISKEIERGGQIFFIHNRIEDIHKITERIQKLSDAFEVKFIHAKMKLSDLEKILIMFNEKKFHVLVSTTIIENGIDIPNANTIIINRAERFGLSQLHQIRGRVGRSDKQAFCYLIASNKNLLTDEAKQRLLALETAEDLGSGFTLASRDLEIRGAGNILGQEQSGEIQEVGFSMYNKMLEKAVALHKSGKFSIKDYDISNDLEIELNYEAFIPDEYINDVNLRLICYKRLSSCKDENDINNLASEFINRFGLFPEQLNNLLKITKLKIKFKNKGIKRISETSVNVKIEMYEDNKVNHEKLIKFLNENSDFTKLEKDNTLKLRLDTQDIDDKIEVLENSLSLIMK